MVPQQVLTLSSISVHQLAIHRVPHLLGYATGPAPDLLSGCCSSTQDLDILIWPLLCPPNVIPMAGIVLFPNTIPSSATFSKYFTSKIVSVYPLSLQHLLKAAFPPSVPEGRARPGCKRKTDFSLI